jgi:uncharacterized protein with HEPN domain
VTEKPGVGQEEPDARRFAPDGGRDADVELTDPESKREIREAETLGEIGICLRDAETLVAMGKRRFDDDWLLWRAAKNIVTEFAETASRLPDRFKAQHPEVPWRAIGGMRNRVVHVYENTDRDTVWNVLASELPAIRRHLGQ